MFTHDERELIRKQSWFNDYAIRGKELIKRDLIHCLEGNEKSEAYVGVQEMGLSEGEIAILYGRILEKAERLNPHDNCSLITFEREPV